MENYKEHAGYKANVTFDNYFDCFFGFYKDETTLCTIVDKALALIHIEVISTQWTNKRFDYRAKMTAARLPWLIGATTLSLIVLSLMFLMFWRQRQEGRLLERQVGERTEELNKQNSLMGTVNAAAAILIEPDTEGGIDVIGSSMEMICQSLDADSVYLWQNIRKDDGRLYYKQVCKWGRAGYAIDEEPHEYSYDDSIPVWNTLFSEGNSLNGPIDTLPENEQEFLSLYKVQSILAVPLFLEGALWGFVNFNDCHSCRFFPEVDEHILRSWGMLVMGAILRGEILQDLKNATDEAKNASEAKSHCVANMGHEMRTPMNVIVGLTNLLLEEETSGKTRDALEKINTAGKNLMELINDVLDMSKIEAGKLELTQVRYDVVNLLNDIITLNMIRIEGKPVTFVLNIEGELPTHLFGDDLRVKQILNNLLSNAFKYTKEGTVTLSINCWSAGRRQKDDLWVSFSVSDTGVGIRKEDIAKLFTDYNQVDTVANREIEGTGLGLSITKKFIELMNGEILVESEYGKGTTFKIRIRQGFVTGDIIDKETVESISSLHYSDKKKQVQEKLIRPNLSDVRVLVVDDFPANLDVAAGMLRKYKMHVDCVTNGNDAINLIAAHEPIYNAIFMDHMMPVMDGMEATKKIRALGTLYAENIPIIALTANVVAGNEQMFLENGFNAFLPKPFNVMTLDTIIQQWVNKNEQ
jgi:signal transduction histidine kinase